MGKHAEFMKDMLGAICIGVVIADYIIIPLKIWMKTL